MNAVKPKNADELKNADEKNSECSNVHSSCDICKFSSYKMTFFCAYQAAMIEKEDTTINYCCGYQIL